MARANAALSTSELVLGRYRPLKPLGSGSSGSVWLARDEQTIGIGAGASCDGQILVLQDLLGMNTGFHPKFARTFTDGARAVTDAVAHFDEAVKAGTCPAAEESY